jgi:Fe-S oxidoreductase
MAEYMPEVMKKVAQERIRNAQCVNANKIVTACPSEYAMLKAVCPENFEIISFESLILEATK